MRIDGKPASDAGALTALVAADGASGGFIKDSERATTAQTRDMSSTTVVLTPSNLANSQIANGHLFGMTLSNGSDATNDIDFAAGSCTDSTGVRRLIGSALTKQLDAAWAAGTNAGGKMSAAPIANTTYHVFAILKDSDGSVDYGFDVSATAPTMPTGYTYFRRIGSIIRSGGAILGFTQQGDEFLLNVPVNNVSAAFADTNAALADLTVPLGLKVLANVMAHVVDVTNAAARYIMVTSPDQTDTAPSSTLFTLAVNAAGAGVSVNDSIFGFWRTNTSAQIRYRGSATDADTYMVLTTYGWIDTRGRLA